MLKYWSGTLGGLLLLGCLQAGSPQKAAAGDFLRPTPLAAFELPPAKADKSGDNIERSSNPVKTTFSISMGPRRDDFRWSIAGRNNSGQIINIRSELEWTDVQSYQVRLDNRTQVDRILYFRGYFDYATIKDGTIRDSDYNGDNHTGEYSRSISVSSGDQHWDMSVGAGYPFQVEKGHSTFMFAPLIGVSLHKQNYRITDGEQVISQAGAAELGSLQGLNSTFEAEWKGPWLGCDMRCRVAEAPTRNFSMEFGLSLEYHFLARYSAKANWNLREDFSHPTSFAQEADGRGFCLSGEWMINPWARWDFQILATYQTWKTEEGSIRFYDADGSVSTNRLNQVHWTSQSVMAGVTYHFF